MYIYDIDIILFCADINIHTAEICCTVKITLHEHYEYEILITLIQCLTRMKRLRC